MDMPLAEHHRWWKHGGAPELRALLMEEWDPIGVRGSPGAADEYDGYLGPIVNHLREGASAQDLAEYLSWVEREYMGMSGAGRTRDELLPLSKRLRRWYVDSRQRWIEGETSQR